MSLDIVASALRYALAFVAPSFIAPSKSTDADFGETRPPAAAGSTIGDPPPMERIDFSRLPYNTIVCDLGDVLFDWSSNASSILPGGTISRMLRTTTWFAYDRGELSEMQCYQALADEFGFEHDQILSAFRATRSTLVSNAPMIALLRRIKSARPDLKAYAMSNISDPDWQFLRTQADPQDWALFDRVFTSAEAHSRKPDLRFYQHVMEQTGLQPSSTLFIDDKIENVLVARSFGWKAYRFTTYADLLTFLSGECADPAGHARSWLRANAGQMHSLTNYMPTLHENFAQLLILEFTGDESLVNYVKHERLFNFFRNPVKFGNRAGPFPCDLDSTSVGLMATSYLSEETKHNVMDEMLTYLNADGLLQTYFDKSRPRVDPVVCVNVLTLFYAHGRGANLETTFSWVVSVLENGAYTDGTLYYYPDAFLFFLSRLLLVAPQLRSRLETPLRYRVAERFGLEGNALSLAMRIVAGARVGLRDAVDYRRLLDLQEADGSWSPGWVYKNPGSDVVTGNRGLTTTVSILAIDSIKAVESGPFPRSAP